MLGEAKRCAGSASGQAAREHCADGLGETKKIKKEYIFLFDNNRQQLNIRDTMGIHIVTVKIVGINQSLQSKLNHYPAG